MHSSSTIISSFWCNALSIRVAFLLIKADCLTSVSHARRTQSISASWCLPEGKLCHQRPWIWRRRSPRAAARLRMSSMIPAASAARWRSSATGNGEDEDRRMFGTLRCWLILDSAAFLSRPLPLPFSPLFLLLYAVLEDEGEVSSSTSSESGINRKGDIPPGLITRKFSCHSPRLILGFWRGK